MMMPIFGKLEFYILVIVSETCKIAIVLFFLHFKSMAVLYSLQLGYGFHLIGKLELHQFSATQLTVGECAYTNSIALPIFGDFEHLIHMISSAIHSEV